MNQEIINLYDDYTHTPLTRGEFIRRLVLITGSLTAAMEEFVISKNESC